MRQPSSGRAARVHLLPVGEGKAYPSVSALALEACAARRLASSCGFGVFLGDRRLSGIKFRRRVLVGPYIVDFLCVGAKLIVEADGFQRAESPHDNARDNYLASWGWKVLRFWNNEVFLNREGVLETVLAHAQERQGKPSSGASRHLLPKGEGKSAP